MSEIRIAGTIEESIVDGPGIRYVIFTQGCPHHCEGCHNPQTHDFEGGRLADTQELLECIQANPLLSGVTFSGGEPFCQPKPLAELAQQIHSIGKTVVAYTGYTFEQLCEKHDEEIDQLLRQCDLLIDGPFVQEQRDTLLRFRGSRNQRLIDIPKTLEQGRIVLQEC